MAVPPALRFPAALFTAFCAALPAQESKAPDSNATVTLRLKDRPLQDAVAQIRKKADAKILVDDGIDERVTIHLTDVSWRTALSLVAEKAGCVMIDRGVNVIKIEKPPRVYFRFHGEPIQKVLDELSKVSGRKIVAAPEVQGSICLRLRNIPWRDALEMSANTLGYAVVEEKSGVFRVVPRSNLREDLVTKSFQLKYVKPNTGYRPIVESSVVTDADFELIPALRRVLTPDLGALEYFEDRRLLIVKDIKPVVDEIQSIIQQIDVKPRRVFLDAYCVRVHKPPVRRKQEADGGWGSVLSGGTIPLRLPFDLGLGFEEGGSEEDVRMLRRIYREAGGGVLEILRAPKCVTEDHEEASLRFSREWAEAEATGGGNTGMLVLEEEPEPRVIMGWDGGLSVDLTPHVVPGTDKIVLDVVAPPDPFAATGTSPLAPAGFDVFTVGRGSGDGQIALPPVAEPTRAKQYLLRSGKTLTIRSLLANDIVLFVIAQILPDEEERDEEIRRMMREREAMVEAERRAIFGDGNEKR